MNLTEARTTLIDSVLHVATNTYPTDKQDRALQFALGIFCRKTKVSRVSLNLELAQGVNTVNIQASVPSGNAAFHPAALMLARIGYDDVQLIDWRRMLRHYWVNSTQTKQPRLIAFETTTGVATIYPTPDQSYTLTVVYWEPLIPWTPGTTDDATTFLNIDERWIRDAIWLGAGTALVYGEVGNLWAQTGWKQFEQYMDQVKGETTLTSGAVQKYDPDNADGGPFWQTGGGLF